MKKIISLLSLFTALATTNNFYAEQEIHSFDLLDKKFCEFPTCNNNLDECTPSFDTPVKTHIHPRSQGANTARELVGWQWEINQPYMCENYGVAYFSYEFQRTFKGEKIAKDLFGGTKLKFTGSAVSDRDPNKELLADNFGLSRDFIGEVSFNPQIESHIIDLAYFLGLNYWFEDTYIRIHFPITHTRWNLKGCELSETVSPGPLEACYVDSSSNEPTNSAQSLQQALSGTFKFGDMQTNWCAGRFHFKEQPRTGVADIDLIIGRNWINNDCYHFGTFFQLVLPTGPKEKNLFIFDPVVGNGGFFELGGGLSMHYSLWSNDWQNLSIFFEGNVTHMFNSNQMRLFDFKNKPFSRYMLLKEFESNGLMNNYNGSLISATCFNNREVRVKVNVKGDASVKLAYRNCNWGMDIGYNIYGHSKEKIELICKDKNDNFISEFENKKLQIKGTEGVCCFEHPIVCVPTSPTTFEQRIFADDATLPAGSLECEDNQCSTDNLPFDDPYTVTTRLSNSIQPDATAFQGIPVNKPVLEDCNIVLDYSSPKVTNSNGQPVATLEQDGFVICNNNNPINFLSEEDFDLSSAEANATLTHKIFAHFNYTWYEEYNWNPHIGIGAEVEFDGKKTNFKNNSSKKHNRTNINQWGVWIKGGISF